VARFVANWTLPVESGRAGTGIRFHLLYNGGLTTLIGENQVNCALAVTALFLLAPCSDSGGKSMSPAISESLSSPQRLEQDLTRDEQRHPDRVLAFFELKPGMQVLDLFSGGGYYTEIVSRIVGPDGKVVAHNNEAYLDYAKDTLEARFADTRLPNVERITAQAADLELPDSTFDAALVMLTWHDFYYQDAENGWPLIDEPALTEKLCAALKPGAVLGISDHIASEGSDPAESAQNLHRIDPQKIKHDLSDSCFSFEGEIDVLRNPEDDHSKPMFAPEIRGHTDRVVYKFRKK
jgi:predicted methyltransferase